MDKKYKLLIISSIIIVVLSFIIYIVNTDRKLNPVEKVIKDGALSVSSIFYKPVNYVKEKINENQEKNNIYKKYKDIKKKYDAIKFDEARLSELEKENKDLKNLLGLENTLSEYDAVNATVVNRNIGYWYNTITIDKGESSGIKKDMAVVTQNGLIGKVINTSYLYSTVRLLSSDELGQKVSVKIKVSDEEYIYGLLSGYDEQTKEFIVEGISENITISEGMIVTTTGMSNIFPSGILVGTVSGIRKDNFDLTSLVVVTPSHNFDDISYVSVLKRKSDVQ